MIIICLIAVGGIATYTYSFFAVTKTNSEIIAGEAESLGLTVTVNRMAPTIESDLIPQMDDYITSAITGKRGSCVDDNGNPVCHTYKVAVTNANVTTKVNGTLTLDKKNNPNLKWAIYKYEENEETGKIEPTLVGNIKSPEEKDLTIDDEFIAGQTKEYYIVVWISEAGNGQTDKGEYSGVVDFITANVVEGQ